MKTISYTYSCLAAAFGGFLFGFDTAVISGALTLVTAQFKMNAIMEGWLVSSGLLGCISGVFLAGALSDRIGRKKVLVLSAVLFMISGIGSYFAGKADILIFVRFLGGIGVGVASVISPMYISEVAIPNQRGRMVAFYQLAITLGILVAYLSNSYILAITKENNHFLSFLITKEIWRSMFLIITFPAFLFISLLLFISESPQWLNAKRIKVKETTTRPLFNKAMRLPLITGILLAVLQQFSGINAIIYYGPKILETAGLTNGKALQAQVIIGAINALFTFVAIVLSDKLGRKPLLLAGLSGMVLSLLTVGACFYTGYTNNIFLLLMLLVFIACFAFSVGPLTWVIINETFPTELRAKAVAICTFALWSAVWVVGQFFPWLLGHMGAAGVFWVFAIFSCINLFFCSRFIVETKGRSLEEMTGAFVLVKTEHS